ncbi:2Fe-2S iron-sulfur cluster binding domain-containing protein [Gluconacetobacter aggeris]|uniref:2Fe-2S iron-sulfur cluster binding domain-containing protein n=2 Tax=Gluconacetobacter aggeris TaxID=1286186 RepID=A0A7W4NWU3_9PROT|nr:2Fe-2S iron-sulfur cluster-binding protein [Gluconacetobacter aggeris]MBB2169211.1 2Fe-2S iron-sulfur cluster binding domain-containing protein [Gluconacetobacter aggeris]
MAAATQALLGELEIPPSRIACEAFGGTSPTTDEPLDTNDYPLRFLPSGTTCVARGTQTVLDAALRSGVTFDQGCLAGVCGRCRIRLVEGEVATGCEAGLSAADKKAGYVLACQTKPRGTVVLADE